MISDQPYMSWVLISLGYDVLFNDTLGTFYTWSYVITHMLKDHSVRDKTCCFHYMGYSFWLAARVLLYAPSHIQDGTFVTPVVEHWLQQEIVEYKVAAMGFLSCYFYD